MKEDIKKVLILGSGALKIGEAGEYQDFLYIFFHCFIFLMFVFTTPGNGLFRHPETGYSDTRKRVIPTPGNERGYSKSANLSNMNSVSSGPLQASGWN